MVKIDKLPDPPLLARYKTVSINPKYKNFTKSGNNQAPFNELREQLLKENKYVCAYCGQRVDQVKTKDHNNEDQDNMKVEHFRPQSLYPQLQLDYVNLLGCCMGNGRVPNTTGQNHCDSKKENNEFKVVTNPALDVSWNEWLDYQILDQSKQILVIVKPQCPYYADLEHDLLITLHLNERDLVSNRYLAYKTFVDTRIDGGSSPSELKSKYQSHPTKLPAFPHMIFTELDKRIRQAQG